MTGPTRPFRPLPLSGILAIAGALATLSVLAIPSAEMSAFSAAPTTPAVQQAGTTTIDESRVTRDATANLQALGQEVSVIFSAAEAVAAAAVN